jgi:hypothetical protein
MFKKWISGLMVTAGLAASSVSHGIVVGGVQWNESSVLDFSAFSVAIRQFVNPITGELSGFGVVSRINDDSANYEYCAAGIGTCELTFQFSGYTPVTAGALPGTIGQVINYTGGTFNVYFDSTPEVGGVLSMNAANTGDGVLWLGMVGHSVGGVSLTGTVNGLFGSVSSLTGGGLLDIVGGAAAAFLDTNTKQDGSDFTFSSSFTQFITPGSLFDATGTGNLNGSTVVPAPGVIALFGLGMLGLAGLGRKRK